MGWKSVPGSGGLDLTTKGDLHGYDTEDKRIPIGTNAHVLTADSAQALGLKWAAAPGANGGTTWLDPVPSGNAAGGPSDDEFDNDAIGGWTQVDAGSSATVTWTEGSDVLSVSSPGESTAHKWHAQMKTIPGGAATVLLETAVRVACYNPGANDFPSVGVCFADGVTPASGSQIQFNFNLRATTLGTGALGHIIALNTTGYDTFGSTHLDNDMNILSPWLHLRLEWQGSNTWQIWYSPDGVSWLDPNAGTISFTMTPTHMGVITTNNGTGGADYIGSWEYLRVTNT